VELEYRFDTDHGAKTRVELFDGRSQLLVYHFMFGTSCEAGCPTCSSMANGIDGLLPHLHARDLTFAFVSQAPLEKLSASKCRMGWSIPWAFTARSDFNLDLGFSSSEGHTREWVEPMADQLPPIALHNAGATGIELIGYLMELFGSVRSHATTDPSLPRLALLASVRWVLGEERFPFGYFAARAARASTSRASTWPRHAGRSSSSSGRARQSSRRVHRESG
jgi:hypothetical protein